MTINEKLSLVDIAVCASLMRDFAATTVGDFNEHLARGNPILGDDYDVVWSYHQDPFMVTVCKCEDMYYCEVTDERNGVTGMFQHAGETALDAWLCTRNEIREYLPYLLNETTLEYVG